MRVPAQCVGEESWAKLVSGQLSATLAKHRADGTLPEALVRAESARHKLTDISGGASREVALDAPLDLEEVRARLESAHFTGKGDDALVMWLTHEFDWQIMIELRAVVRAERLGARLAQAALHVKAELSRMSRVSISRVSRVSRVSRMSSGGERPSKALMMPTPAAEPSARTGGSGAAWGLRLPRRQQASQLLVVKGGRRSLPPEYAGTERATDAL